MTTPVALQYPEIYCLLGLCKEEKALGCACLEPAAEPLHLLPCWCHQLPAAHHLGLICLSRHPSALLCSCTSFATGLQDHRTTMLSTYFISSSLPGISQITSALLSAHCPSTNTSRRSFVPCPWHASVHVKQGS